ncbi:MAG: deoxyguanosinetriphosphate triphosphohydrolase, partial [Ardenticatenales bacterium]|nr:deoxyguanosinetriphosphate triphosphohydrolase [Ardenticatenales bacterium]
MLTRQEYEKIEETILAPWAAHSGKSEGRAVPEDEHPYRSAFQKDRDRIIHTTAFRRLEYKTQVFVNFEGDYYRTRLTHTIEAAQIGRTIARTLRLNEDLTEAITLAHDLGHTPFGHAGEQILNKLMADYGGFDHNKQTLRIVTELEHRFPEFHGLNLTYEVREGIVKHESEYDLADPDNGAYQPHLHPTLEALVVNYCDAIAYTTHDLDDGLRSNIVSVEQLRAANLGLVNEALEMVGEEGTWSEITRHRLIRKLINLLVSDLLHTSNQRITSAGVTCLDDVRQCDKRLVAMSEEMASKEKALKRFLYENMYRHYRVVRMSVKAQRVLAEIWNEYVARPEQLPPSTQARIPALGIHRVVTDYIAGMTDRYAL